MDLAGAHTRWSYCEKLRKEVCDLSCAFDYVHTTCGIVSCRIYHCFESAHKRAENRMASCDVTQNEISRQILRLGLEGRSEEEVNVSCPICLHPLLQSDEGGEDEAMVALSHFLYSLSVRFDEGDERKR